MIFFSFNFKKQSVSPKPAENISTPLPSHSKPADGLMPQESQLVLKQLRIRHSVDSPAPHPVHIQLEGALDTSVRNRICLFLIFQRKQTNEKTDSALLQHSKNCNGGEVISATDDFHTFQALPGVTTSLLAKMPYPWRPPLTTALLLHCFL